MKSLVFAAVIALVAVTPALAKSPKHLNASQHVLNANALIGAPDPIGVYVNGREIGRDPDANIRQALQDSYYGIQGH